MKKIHKILFLSAALALPMVSCQDEVLVPTPDNTKIDALLAEIETASENYVTLDAANNTLSITNSKLADIIDSLDNYLDDLQYPNSQPTEVHYTINLISAGNAELTWGRSKGLEGATVVVEQNGLVLSPSSSDNGLYLFKGLTQGYVFVKISAPNHTEVEYRAYLYRYTGQDVQAATSYNASTQVVIYPNSGALAGTISGKAYANTSTLNDTLNRKYGTTAAFAAGIRDTYVAAPGLWRNYSNYTQDNYWTNAYDLYENWSGAMVNFTNEFALAGHKIYAYPDIDDVDPLPSDNGSIFSVLYKGVITSTTIGADGSFSLPVLAAGEADGLIDDIYLNVANYTGAHTRFTESGPNFYGETNETGSTESEFSYYNNSDGTWFGVYDGTFTGPVADQVDVAAGKAVKVKRRTVVDQYIYMPFFPVNGDISYNNYYGNSNFNLGKLPAPGETIPQNIFFFPIDK